MKIFRLFAIGFISKTMPNWLLTEMYNIWSPFTRNLKIRLSSKLRETSLFENIRSKGFNVILSSNEDFIVCQNSGSVCCYIGFEELPM